jgi:hypothetical protein
LKVQYKPFPIDKPDAAFPEKVQWWPIVPVRLVDKRMTVKTKAFSAVVDSGSGPCLFHADALKPFHIKLESGIEGTLGGIGKVSPIPVFYHTVRILVGLDWVIEVQAGFSEQLAVAGILGRNGFFDSFRIVFDHSTHPPTIDISKLDHKTVH